MATGAWLLSMVVVLKVMEGLRWGRHRLLLLLLLLLLNLWLLLWWRRWLSFAAVFFQAQRERNSLCDSSD